MPDKEMRIKKVLIFDIEGPMAHFRKYYTNSSSLTYLFPPRTVVAGLIAGLLGMSSERFSSDEKKIYYEKLDDKKSFIAVSIRSKTRKIMQTVNYYNIKIKNNSLRYQTPLEILVPDKDEQIKYRIYFYHSNEEIYDALKERLEKQDFIYPPYLGITEFLAHINYVGEGAVMRNSNQKIDLSSVCKIKDIELDFSTFGFRYINELMPTGFSNDRIPKKTEVYVGEINTGIIKGVLHTGVSSYTVEYLEGGCKQIENIMPM